MSSFVWQCALLFALVAVARICLNLDKKNNKRTEVFCPKCGRTSKLIVSDPTGKYFVHERRDLTEVVVWSCKTPVSWQPF